MINQLKKIILNNSSQRVVSTLRYVRGYTQEIISCTLPEGMLNDEQKVIREKAGLKIRNPAYTDNALAFRGYSKGSGFPIPLIWVSGKSQGNFGDWLSPYVISKLVEAPIIHIDDYKKPGFSHVVAIGSIASMIGSKSHVFGTGIGFANEKINPFANYYFVRGPHTNKALRMSHGPNVDCFGDMGFLLSKIYSPLTNAEKTIDILFVRHYLHKKIPIKLPENSVEISINASSPESIELFIDRLMSAKIVVTSAMHCYIVCKSYNIPCALVDFDTELDIPMFGDSVKYLDAMLGAGLKPFLPHKLPMDMRYFDFDSIVNDEALSSVFVDDLFVQAVNGLHQFLAINK